MAFCRGGCTRGNTGEAAGSAGRDEERHISLIRLYGVLPGLLSISKIITPALPPKKPPTAEAHMHGE